jgi:4-hydroxy-tetrahydrodipicolinate reductase
MKIALIGHGAMGKMIEGLATGRGHEIVAVIDHEFSGVDADALATELTRSEAVIDFSAASAVRRNVEAAVQAGVPLVEGTTGWDAERDEIERFVNEGNGALIFGANFSIGVNLFYRIADHAAELFAKFHEYETFIEEQHHSRKKDAPSGTALKLKDIVSGHIEKEFSIAATRAGNIPGTHRVGFDGATDQILLEHTARSREGFAAGAITAAEWIVGRTGFYEFGEVMDEIIRSR